MNIDDIFGDEVSVDTSPPPLPPASKTYEDFDFDDLQLYAGMDCIATSELLAKLFPTITREQTLFVPGPNGEKTEITAPAIIKSVTEIEMVAHEFILDLEINGMAYDCDKNREISARMVNEIGGLDDRIFSALGKRINLDSGDEVSNLIYGELGFTAPFQTKSGADATDGVALLTLAGLDPLGGKYVTEDPAKQFLADMAKRKDISSVHNTFIKTYIEDFVKRDGRIHPRYPMISTSSFRVGQEGPNLAQLPRAKHGYNVRECYVSEPGHVLILYDFSSCEVAVLAAICKDAGMLRALRDKLNFHAFSASAMIGIPYEVFMDALSDKNHTKHKEYKNLRQTAKTLECGVLT